MTKMKSLTSPPVHSRWPGPGAMAPPILSQAAIMRSISSSVNGDLLAAMECPSGGVTSEARSSLSHFRLRQNLDFGGTDGTYPFKFLKSEVNASNLSACRSKSPVTFHLAE